jgi:hypothetical protein
MVAGGQLQINWNYSEALHDKEEIERVAGLYFDELPGAARALSPAGRRWLHAFRLST